MAPAKTACSGPKRRCTRRMSSSRRALGKVQVDVRAAELVSSEMNRSRVRPQLKGSTWLMPMR